MYQFNCLEVFYVFLFYLYANTTIKVEYQLLTKYNHFLQLV